MSGWFVTLYRIEWMLILCYAYCGYFFPFCYLSLNSVCSNLYWSLNLYIIHYASRFPWLLWIYFLLIFLQVFYPLGIYFCALMGDRDLAFAYGSAIAWHYLSYIPHFPQWFEMPPLSHVKFSPMSGVSSLLCPIGPLICCSSDITLL